MKSVDDWYLAETLELQRRRAIGEPDAAAEITLAFRRAERQHRAERRRWRRAYLALIPVGWVASVAIVALGALPWQLGLVAAVGVTSGSLAGWAIEREPKEER